MLFSALATVSIALLACSSGSHDTGTHHSIPVGTLPKPGHLDVRRIASANLAAASAYNLVSQRNCRDLPCLVAATADELSAVRDAETVASSVLPKLDDGRCRQVIAAIVSAWTRRATLIAKARSAWQRDDNRAAVRSYTSDSWDTPLAEQFAARCI